MNTMMNPIGIQISPKWPSSVLEAAQILIEQIPPEDRISITTMSLEEMAFLNLSLGTYIRNTFGLWEGNVVLLESCAEEAEMEFLHQEEASAVILARMALELKKTEEILSV